MRWVTYSSDDTIEEDHKWRVQFTSPSGMMSSEPFEKSIEIPCVGRVQYASLVGNWLYLASAVAIRAMQMGPLMAILHFSSILLSEPTSLHFDMSVLQVCDLQ
jgi:hypothetical protein